MLEYAVVAYLGVNTLIIVVVLLGSFYDFIKKMVRSRSKAMYKSQSGV